jgi:hypothetical protein
MRSNQAKKGTTVKARSRLAISMWISFAFIAWVIWMPGISATGQEPAAKESQLPPSVQRFSTVWKDSDWVHEFRGIQGYIRPADDEHWKARYRALRAVVKNGDASVSPLMKMLKEGSTEEQVFAAQALSFLAPESVADELLAAAESSPNAAVRLYCVDALATLGERSIAIDWKKLASKQTDRDVLKHIDYAIKRRGQPVAKKHIDALLSFHDDQAGSARVGELAPDFTLETIDDRSVQLSSYRGKKSVVLVFIYGDT